MGLLYVDCHMSEDDEEDDQLVSMDSQPVAKLDKEGEKHPSILDVRLPFCNTSTVPFYVRFLNASKQLDYDTDIVEYSMPNLLNFPHISTSLVSIPVIPRSSEFFIESSCHRRIRSTSDLVDLFVSRPGNLLVSSATNFTFDSDERSTLKSSLFFELGNLDGVSTPLRAISFSSSPTRTSTFTSSSFGIPSPLSQVPNSEVTSCSNQNEVQSMNVPGKMFYSDLSSNSAGLCQPDSSPCLTVSVGLLHCTLKNGSLSIVFTEGDDRRKVYTANSLKIESSMNKSLDYIYSFHSKIGNKPDEFVGKMKVSSSLLLNSDQSKLIETEFVLCGVEGHSTEVHSSSSKNKTLSKMVANIFRTSHSSKPKTKHISVDYQAEALTEDSFLSQSSDFDEFENGFVSNLELAAIVMRSSTNCSEKEAKTAGWGLKFLEKVPQDGAVTSSCEGSHVQIKRNTLRGMDVLIPAGFHGGAIKRDGGPSSLIERWRSGGCCDCIGWDIGCPLTVLHDGRSSFVPNFFNKDDSEDNCKSMVLFLEGTRDQEPRLKIVQTSEGMYALYFQPTLTTLQAFAVGVAFIHSQSPSLHPKF